MILFSIIHDRITLRAGDKMNKPVNPTSIISQYDSAIKEHLRIKNVLFLRGIANYHEIEIPNFNNRMTSLQMKELYVRDGISANGLSPLQLGALHQYINIKSREEHVNYILNTTARFSLLFTQNGCIDKRLIPQNFYLSLIGDKYTGRCYPLVRTMSVALASKGNIGANNLVDNLFLAAASPESENTNLLKHAIANLHSNIDATLSSTLVGNLNLLQIRNLFYSDLSDKMYALNSKKHSMLLGQKTENDIINYYFFDPNFGLFIFDDKNKLFSSLNEFMLTKKMAKYYSAEGTSNVPIFELLEIDTEKMANVYVGNGLRVSDIVDSSDLLSISQNRQEIESVLDGQKRIMSDLQLQCSLEIVEAQLWGDKLEESINLIAKKYELNNKWLPTFSNVRKLNNGNYLVPFVYQRISEEPRWLEVSDESFIEFFDYFYEKISKINKFYIFNNNELQLVENIEQTDDANSGLNSAIAVQALIQSIENKKYSTIHESNISKNLATALKVNSYVNYIMIGQNNIHDSVKVTELISKLWRQSDSAINNAPTRFTLAIANKVHEGIGYSLTATQLSLDIYEFANANTEEEKAVFGTQLAFDTMTLATGLAGTYANTIGASATATVFGSVGIILNGLGIGFAALSRAFSKVADNAKSVGIYFDYLDKAYQDNGYDFEEKHQILVPRFGAVIRKINLHIGNIEFDSQYIYRTSEKSAGGGRHNYIFWAGNFPHVIHDRNQALNIRENIGYIENTHDLMDSENIILPITPKSYIDYTYNILPGATTRNDLGFSVARRLEQTDKFDYDFYIFPFENTITKLTQEYVHTPIEIILSNENKNIIIPKMPIEWHGKIHYDIRGKGNEYHISINYGASITLHHHMENENPTTWIINSSEINGDNITIDNNRIIIDGFIINIDRTSSNDMLKLVNNSGEVKLVNLSTKTATVIMEDGNQWIEKNSHLEQYLNNLNKHHQLYEKYIVINDYHHKGNNVGRAYYDTEYQRILFTDSNNEENQHAILSAVDDNNAYFYTPNSALFWRVNIQTGTINMRYDASHIIASNSKITRLWQENDQTYINFIHHHENKTITSTYRIFEDNIVLLSITDNQLLIDKLINTPTNLLDQDLLLLSSHDFLVHHLTPQKKQQELLSNTVIPNMSSIISIRGKDQYGINQHFWLRLSDGVLIKPNLELPHNEVNPNSTLSQTQSQWPIPFDLAFVSSNFNIHGEEVFFFYSKQYKCIFRQRGLGQNILDINNATAKHINIENIKEVINWENSILASTDEGYIYQINADGQPKIVAVNGLWFNDKTNWQRDLENIVKSDNLLTVFGLKNIDNYQIIPAWYINNRVALLPTVNTTNILKFLGFTPNNDEAFIFNSTTGELYCQKTVNLATLYSAFHEHDWLQSPDILPDYINAYPNVSFKNIKRVDTGLLMLTDNNQLIFHNISGDANNKTFKSTLIIRGKKSTDVINPSLIEDVKTLIISGGNGADTYKFNLDSWKGYDAIVINNYATDRELDRVILPIYISDNIYFNRKNDDFVLTDMTNTTTLIIRQVWGAQAIEHQHLHLNFANASNPIEIRKLIEFYDLHKGVLTLEQYIHPTFEPKPELEPPHNSDQLIDSMSAIDDEMDISLIDGVQEHLSENHLRSIISPMNH